MAKYTVGTVFAADTAVSASDLDAEFGLVQTALNSLDLDNFDDDSVPHTSLVRQRGGSSHTVTRYNGVNILNQLVFSGQSTTRDLHLARLSEDRWLSAVSAYAGQITGTISAQMMLTRDSVEFRAVGPALVFDEGEVVSVDGMDVLLEAGQDLTLRVTFGADAGTSMRLWRWTAATSARLVDHA